MTEEEKYELVQQRRDSVNIVGRESETRRHRIIPTRVILKQVKLIGMMQSGVRRN